MERLKDGACSIESGGRRVEDEELMNHRCRQRKTG